MTTLVPPYDKNKQAIAGSWYPTGYHGHSRTGRRNDFINEFRYRAKPQPPVVFIQRSQEPPDAHIFSFHDNREAYLRPEQSCPKRELIEKGPQPRLFDGEFFDLGLGKRKLGNTSQRSDNRMFWWKPQQVDFETKGTPDLSSYRASYNAQQQPRQVYVHEATAGQASANTPQALTRDRFTTIYGYSYNHQNNKGVINVMNNAALTGIPPKSAPTSVGRRRPLTNFDTVRSCLVWPTEQRKEKLQAKPKEAMSSYIVPQQKEETVEKPVPPPFHPTDATSVPLQLVPVQMIPQEAMPPTENERLLTVNAPFPNSFGPVCNKTAMPMPAAGLCDDYGPKPLVFAPVRGGTAHGTPISNDATMAAVGNKHRGLFGCKSTEQLYDHSQTATVCSDPPRPQTRVVQQTSEQPVATSTGEPSIARSKSEADMSRPRSITFSTCLW